jgi:N-hydroxyarylamine O-acetyltransferase
MDAGAYLARIGAAGGEPPSDSLLARLQEAHLRSVPFENLDIHTGEPIVLDIPRLYEKIVVRRRGGFCYELNGLFHWLLTRIGFSADMVSARVYDREKEAYGPPFDHMALIVTTGSGRWLADVGFGEFAMRPLRVAFDYPQDDPAGKFVLRDAGDGTIGVSRWSDESRAWIPQYDFTARPRRLGDFAGMCLHQQTSPDSHFTRKRVCSLATADGRITLSGDRLITTSGGTRTETAVDGEEGFRSALRERFRIILA